MITQARLLSVCTPNFETGTMVWHSPSKYHREKQGRNAGCAGYCGKPYWMIKIDGRRYRRGRLMFLAKFGRFPHPCIDHINGDSLDDRLCNLREATVQQNAWNHKPHSRRIQLPMGVRLIPGSGNYQARISCNKKQYHLGSYPTPEEAHLVYLAKRKEFFGDFA